MLLTVIQQLILRQTYQNTQLVFRCQSLYMICKDVGFEGSWAESQQLMRCLMDRTHPQSKVVGSLIKPEALGSTPGSASFLSLCHFKGHWTIQTQIKGARFNWLSSAKHLLIARVNAQSRKSRCDVHNCHYSKCKTDGESRFLRFGKAKHDENLVRTAVYIP